MRIEPILRALDDATRLRILRLLAHMELAVGELAQVLGQSQPRVSRHVRILSDAGLAERRKEGSWVFLTLADRTQADALFALTDVAADEVTTRRMPYAASTGTIARAWASPAESRGRSQSSWLQRDRDRALA